MPIYWTDRMQDRIVPRRVSPRWSWSLADTGITLAVAGVGLFLTVGWLW